MNTMIPWLVALTLVGCQAAPESKRRALPGGGSSTKADSTDSIPVSVSFNGESGGFNLKAVSASAFQITVQCDEVNLVVRESPFYLPGPQTGCSSTLDQFTANGEDYLRDANNPGAYATISGTTADVVTESALPANIDGPIQIAYNFSLTERDDDAIVDLNEVNISIIGEQVPNYALRKFGLNNGALTFIYECFAQMEGSGNDAICEGDALSDLQFNAEPLVEDLNLSFVNKEFLDQLFAAGSSSLAGGQLSHIAPGTSLINGGFAVQVPLSASIRSSRGGIPAGYILALKHKDSYRYQKLTIRTNSN